MDGNCHHLRQQSFDLGSKRCGRYCQPLCVCFGSLTDIRVEIRDVRFAPESGHVQRRNRTLLMSPPESVFCLALHRGFWASIRVAEPRDEIR
jgi:hypothetical protein